MAEVRDIDMKVSNEGRVVIPAAVRSVLGVGPGDRVRFVVEGRSVSLVNAQSLLYAVWANNEGGDAGDATTDVRAARRLDIARSDAKWERMESLDAEETRSEQDIEGSLLEQLGLVQ